MSAQLEQDQYWSCLRKVRFLTRKEARHMLRQFAHKYGMRRKLYVYACRHCGCWHHASVRYRRSSA